MKPHSLILLRGEQMAVHRLHKNMVSVRAFLEEEHCSVIGRMSQHFNFHTNFFNVCYQRHILFKLLSILLLA